MAALKGKYNSGKLCKRGPVGGAVQQTQKAEHKCFIKYFFQLYSSD